MIGTCDMSRLGPAPIEQLMRINDANLNVALGIPLGIAIGLVHGWRLRAILIVAAIALPFVVNRSSLSPRPSIADARAPMSSTTSREYSSASSSGPDSGWWQ